MSFGAVKMMNDKYCRFFFLYYIYHRDIDNNLFDFGGIRIHNEREMTW